MLLLYFLGLIKFLFFTCATSDCVCEALEIAITNSANLHIKHKLKGKNKYVVALM